MEIKFPSNPIKGQIYIFTDYCPGPGFFSSIHVYTGDKWVKMRTQDTSYTPKEKVQTITNRIKPIK
jgi:hypothetical protein